MPTPATTLLQIAAQIRSGDWDDQLGELLRAQLSVIRAINERLTLKSRGAN